MQTVSIYARLVLSGSHRSFSVGVGCLELQAVLAAANWRAHQSCLFAGASLAIVVVGDAAGEVEAVNTDHSVAGALGGSARRVLVALEVGPVVLWEEEELARLWDPG